MQDKLHPLINEVKRLVTAPYVPSLQDLYGIVHDVPYPIIYSWAICKPCQVVPLVDILVNALAYSNIALDLVTIFAPVAAFRNAVFERYPASLDWLLQKADEPKYSTTCTALLSAPLPAEFTAPARLASFLVRLVNQMAENPNTETIRPIYKLIKGLQTSPRILYDIPLETMSTLEGVLRNILRNMDDHVGSLLCLAIFACLVSSQKLNYDSDYGPQVPTWLQNARHFFGPKRCQKTLDIVSLRVILSCSDNYGNMTTTEAAECVHLAIDICDCAEPEQKEVWAAGNLPNFAKLQEKIMRKGIAYEVQMMGIIFIISLHSTAGLDPKMCKLGYEGMLSKDSRLLFETIPLEFVPRFIKVSSLYLGKRAVRAYVTCLFSALKPRPGPENGSIPALKMALSILHGLRECGFNLPELMKEIYLCLKDCDIRALMETFPRKPLQLECNESHTCYAALSAAENDLLIDLFSAYFCASVIKRGGSMGADKEETTIAADFMARVKECTRTTKCASTATRLNDTHTISSRFGTRNIYLGSRRNWETNNLASHSKPMSNLDDVCDNPGQIGFDEEALSPVGEDFNAISGEPNCFLQHSSDLELQLQQSAGSNESPNKKPSKTTTHGPTASHNEKCTRSDFGNAEDLQARLYIARRELEIQTQTVHKEREAARAAEREFKTRLAEKDDLLKNLQKENGEQGASNQDLRAALDSKEESLSRLNRDVEKQADESKKLKNKMRLIELEKEEIEKKLLKEASEADELSATLDKIEEQFRCDTEALEKEHEAKLSDTYSEIARQREENETLQQSMQDAASLTAAQVETKDKRIRHLEAKVQSLRDERAVKACEFSIAQEHIGRLMDVMGFKSGTDTSTPARSDSPPDDSQVATPFDEATQTQDDELEDEDASTLTLNTRRSFTTKPWQKVRGEKPGSGAGCKRKPTEELSGNKNIIKARARLDKISPDEQNIERAQNADRQAIRRAIVDLQTTAAYKKASSSTREKMVQEKEQSVIKTRNANGWSAKRVAQNLGYEEDNTELQNNDGSHSWENDTVN